ncbi:S-adenosyl-L-methionine-dependent methyltransferase [Durotheca rogersii]|uniref:S-adenosyl-L-methionine-dependent methyltransferase n=1 Tax=Durotheca rogersii TaxID=419775 RepID=UPI00221FBC07|nr:S-adenosyl-L-methionine-dependent methyltransferase [Durotheca rogersii]KAI5863833.1 S-adenosyl-L-methionine-dependent methyltransferase [Durotheca rogersii]
MDAVFEQLRTLAAQADSAGRYKVLDFLHDLQLRLETPHDTLTRLSGMHLEIAAARIGEDLNLFQILDKSEEPLSVADLAAQTKAEPAFLGRILRYLAATGMVRETGADLFAASAVTRTLALPGYRGAVYHFFDNLGPSIQALPDFLAGGGYRDVDGGGGGGGTAFNRAFATDLPPFKWLAARPERFAPFQHAMTVQGAAAAAAPWFRAFPLAAEVDADAGAADAPFLVDVGGGFGHQCAALAAAFPALRGRLVLEDLPEALAAAPALDGVRAVPHDFFAPQPVAGARFYYLRHVLHDWPDARCLDILRQLRPALGPRSHVLLDEAVLPDAGVSREAATLDLLMMTSLGARERTRAQWRALLDAAGLRILHIHTYMPRRQDSIIQAVPK